MTDAPPGALDLLWDLLQDLVWFSSWVNITMIAASLGMMFLGKGSDRVMIGGIVLMILILLLVQGTDRVFAGGLVSSLVGLVAAGLFIRLMLKRQGERFYNSVPEAVSFVVLVPVGLVNLVIFGVRASML